MLEQTLKLSHSVSSNTSLFIMGGQPKYYLRRILQLSISQTEIPLTQLPDEIQLRDIENYYIFHRNPPGFQSINGITKQPICFVIQNKPIL